LFTEKRTNEAEASILRRGRRHREGKETPGAWTMADLAFCPLSLSFTNPEIHMGSSKLCSPSLRFKKALGRKNG